GDVKVWQVKQTPMEDLRSGPRQNIQFTPVQHSLAADKPVSRPQRHLRHAAMGISGVGGAQQPAADAAKYDPATSATWRMIHEQETGGKPGGAPARSPAAVNGAPASITHKIAAPTTDYAAMEKRADMEAKAAAGAPVCIGCGRQVIGVFVKANDKTLHPDCFNCTTCGSNLKNQGYWVVDDKLYCEVHYRAKTVRLEQEGGSKFEWPPQKPYPEYDEASAGANPHIYPGPATVESHPHPSYAPPPAAAPPAAAAPSQVSQIQVQVSPARAAPPPWSAVGSGGAPSGPPASTFQSSFGAPPASGAATAAPPAGAPEPQPSHAPVPAAVAPPAGWAQKPSTPAHAKWTAPATTAPTSGGAPMGGGGTAPAGGRFGSTGTPRRGRGVLNQPTGRVPVCSACGGPIRGPFIAAMGKTWCPEHFICANARCRAPLQNQGFVEENGQLYCERDYELYFAPRCSKCSRAVVGDCLNAMDRQWHPECFTCTHCRRPFGNNSFYLEDSMPYCEKDWNELFTTKCAGCGYSIEAGDHWVEALGNNYHSQCFKCSVCQVCLEGQSFYAKGGRPFCKRHATGGY
ncbi:PREDICTED: PDZ and LIM domain protein Zasp-like, partial [Priapulus caudatus]|uniref:PDZ and LIM domain protein Zasp-like n=1 Tax=Priapulus caudatus TaxID=37621 RepID=A0ABM1EW43_PRICU